MFWILYHANISKKKKKPEHLFGKNRHKNGLEFMQASSSWRRHHSLISLMVLFHTNPSTVSLLLVASLFISRCHTSTSMLMDCGGWTRLDLFLCCSFHGRMEVHPIVLEPTLRLLFPKGMLNLAAFANYLWKDSYSDCHQFQGHRGFFYPICSTIPDGKIDGLAKRPGRDIWPALELCLSPKRACQISSCSIALTSATWIFQDTHM